MATEVFTKEQQAFGQFNGGEILENKPLGFPQDGGRLSQYSNLFYWAHAWTPGTKSLIGEHPHRGFEILSFVLEGSVSHYDNKVGEWQPLEAGDVQIIRSGSGVRHAEMVNKSSAFFQIWFDPNLSESLSHDPSYDNYKADVFPLTSGNGITKIVYKGDDSPLNMLTPGVEIYELKVEGGSYSIPLNQETIRSTYLLEGDLTLEGFSLKVDDFVLTDNSNDFVIASENGARLFVIDTPLQPGYRTYAESRGIGRGKA